MLKTLTIQNFRCFEEISIEPLERVNLIGGKNNVGKTALLEAVWIHHGYYNPELSVRIEGFRGIDSFKANEFLSGLFSGFDRRKTIRISGKDEAGTTRTFRITSNDRDSSSRPLRTTRTSKQPTEEGSAIRQSNQQLTVSGDASIEMRYASSTGFKAQARAFVANDRIDFQRFAGAREPEAIFMSARRRDTPEELAERLSNLDIQRTEMELVRFMSSIDNRVKDVSVQFKAGKPMIFADIGLSLLVPLPLLGDGISRFLGLALAIANAQGGKLLIDEIENGLHYSVLPDVWAAISELARKYNVQVFATTHSHECVLAAHRQFQKGSEYDLRYHRLEWVKGRLVARTLDRETLDATLERGVEYR